MFFSPIKVYDDEHKMMKWWHLIKWEELEKSKFYQNWNAKKHWILGWTFMKILKLKGQYEFDIKVKDIFNKVKELFHKWTLSRGRVSYVFILNYLIYKL